MAKLPDFITAENELDGQEHVYIAQGGKTRKTLLQKIKEFVIGTATMGTTANDITGAIAEHTSQLNDITNSGYFDISKDAKGAHYKTIKENGFYRNVTGTPTTGTGGVLLVISNTDKWSVAYKWLSISNTVITEYNACKDGDNYEEWKEISTNDTGWINLPLSSGIVVDSGLTPQYRKIGNRVFIRGSVKNILNGNSVIGTLPVGFRPVLQNHHYATFTNTNACASFNISTDGRIIYQGNSTNTFNAEWFVVITNNFII